MEHEAPLNCSSQIIHAYIHAYIRVPKRDRNRIFPAKHVLNRIFSHLDPGQKSSSKFILNFPARTSYIIQGDLLYIHMQITLVCRTYIHTTKAFVELLDASHQLKFNQTGGSTLHCVKCRLQFYYMYCTEARTCTLSC